MNDGEVDDGENESDENMWSQNTTATKKYAETTSTEVKLHLKLANFFCKLR